MALITCPECNPQISDRAASCPHCGYPLSVVADTVTVNDPPAIDAVPQESAQPVTIAKPRKKRILLIAVICALVLACIGGVAAFAIIKNQQERAEQEAQRNYQYQEDTVEEEPNYDEAEINEEIEEEMNQQALDEEDMVQEEVEETSSEEE